jgi:hypothetical protein
MDTYLDIVVANFGTDNIGIFLGNGNGTFASQIIYSNGLGSHPSSVATGDFNNDTLLDIVVANYGTNSISVFLGDGNGRFGSQIITSLGSSHPLAIAVADFNKDNQLDIVVANYGTLNFAILFGYNNGSFRIDTIYYMGYDSIPYSLAIADFNNDNHFDIAVINYGTSEFAILLGNGNKSFIIQKYSTGVGSNPCSFAVADFNKDNKLDIVIANAGTSNVGLFLGNGNGSFTNLTTYPTGFGSRPQFIIVGDLNVDNKLDVVIIDSRNNDITVFKGYGNGTFSIIATHSTGYNSGPSSIGMGDFDNDNKPDIVITNNNTNNILLLFGYTAFPVSNTTWYPTGTDSSPNFVAVADLNYDNLLDIVVADSGTDYVGIFINLGNGIFGNQQTYYTIRNSETRFVAIADVDNDKKLDIIIVLSATSQIGVLFGYGDGIFSYGYTYSTGYNSYPESIALIDLNNDNNLDIVVPNYYGGNVGIMFGYGDGSFTSVSTYLTNMDFYPTSVAVGDLNNDTIIDIVAANFYYGGLGILLGYGNGSFGIPTIISTDEDYPQCVTLGDLNNDNHLDIVFSSPAFFTVGVLLGYGNGRFTAIARYSTGRGSYPWCVILVDLNNDTLLDIAVGNAYDGTIGLFLGIGNGTFPKQSTFIFTAGYLPYSLAFGDFNNDNQPDIVSGIYGNSYIAVFLIHYEEDFTQEVSYMTGSGPHPYSVVIGEFNNDNQSDMVVANSGTDNIQVALDYSKGAFISKITYSTGSDSYPNFVTTADFNKDNRLDIAVANFWADNINVFLGFGNESFDEASVHSTDLASFPESLAVGDFNNDTWMDIAVANSGNDNIGILLGFDFATFLNQTINVPGGVPTPFRLAVADFNNDHQWDIVVANRDIAIVGIYLGYGNGTFSQQISYQTGYSSSPISVAVGDFNSDNQLDIVVANSDDNNIGLFLGYGNGSFQPQQTLSTGSSSYPVSLAVGDFNNDSRLDIVVVNQNSDNVRIYLSYGNGTFATPIVYRLPSNSYPNWVVAGDLNNDKILDIAVANYYRDSIAILFGYGNGSVGKLITLSTGYYSGPSTIALADLNQDNLPDIAVANNEAQNIQVYFGYGNGTFVLQTTYSTGSSSYMNMIVAQDVNNDAILDILVTDNADINGNIRIFYGVGNGKFTLPKIYSTGTNSQPSSIAICDFNNDNRVDIAITLSNKDSIGIMLRYKSEPFATQTTFSTGNHSQPTSVAVADFNNDDQLDIAVTNSGTNNIGILFGYGNGNFTDQFIYSTGDNSDPYALATGDFNNDHYLDIAFVNSGTDNIGILLGYGNGSFYYLTTYSTGLRSDPSSIAIDDLNKDNHLDLVIANWGINNILVFFGLGNGTFSEPKLYSVGYNARPQSVAISDINNDNLLDIVVANFGSDYVEILLQTC